MGLMTETCNVRSINAMVTLCSCTMKRIILRDIYDYNNYYNICEINTILTHQNSLYNYYNSYNN